MPEYTNPAEFFEDMEQTALGEAPGRLDVFGGVADYAGALVLPTTLHANTKVWVTHAPKKQHEWHSGFPFHEHYTCSSNQLEENTNLLERGTKVKDFAGTWKAYIAGCLKVFYEETKIVPKKGLKMYIESTIPPGKGASSSAALEVALLHAMEKLHGVSLGKLRLPVLARKAENNYAHSPCGIMDQAASALGKNKHLLPVHCCPFSVDKAQPLPEGFRVIGIDSGKKHAINDSGAYSQVRTASFMAYSIIAQHLLATPEQLEKARKNEKENGLPYHGFLATIPLKEYEERFRDLLPEKMLGGNFKSKFKVLSDPLSKVVEDDLYPVRAAADLAIYTNAHAKVVLNKMQNQEADVMETLGTSMYRLHEQYNEAGLGAPGTNRLVEMAHAKGTGKGIYGARVSGGGSGGTVVMLCKDKEGFNHARQIFLDYSKEIEENISWLD